MTDNAEKRCRHYQQRLYQLFDDTQIDPVMSKDDCIEMLGGFAKYVMKQITAQKNNVDPASLKHFDVALIPIEMIRLIEKQAKDKRHG